MCILFLLSPAFYLGADGKMKPAISRTGSRGLPAGSVTWPDGTSSQPELHLLLLEISFWIFLLPGWVPVRKCLFAKNKQELVAIERWPVCCLHLWHHDCNGHQNLAWECLFWVNWTRWQQGRECQTQIAGSACWDSPVQGWEAPADRWPVSHLCAKQGITMSDLFQLFACFLSPDRYQSLEDLASLISSLALTSLCVCIKWASGLLLSSELRRIWETMPALLPAPQNVPACPRPLCCCGESLPYTSGGSSPWGWSHSLSVWGMQHLHRSWLKMCDESHIPVKFANCVLIIAEIKNKEENNNKKYPHPTTNPN